MKYQVSPERMMVSGLSGSTLTKAIFVVAFMMVSILGFGQSPEIRKAMRLIDIEQPSKGIAELEKLAGSNATNQYYLGLGYLRTGNTAKAEAAFDKGISLDEKSAINFAGKGHVKLLAKNTTEAKTNFDKALSMSKSKDAAVLKAVGEAYLVDSKYVLDAINVLNKAKEKNNTDPEVHMLLGDAYLMQNNGGESVSSYERAATADKNFAKPYFKVAKVWQRSKNHDMVMENLNKAITVDPEYAPAYKELGQVYYLKKQPEKAVEAYEKYLTITENPGDAKYQLAFFYFMARNFEKANAIFSEVTNSPNASPTALKFYAITLIEQNKGQDPKSAEVISRAEKASQILNNYFQKVKPEDIAAMDYAYYGNVLVQLNQDSLANENFARSLELDSAQTEVLQAHGSSYMKRRKYAEAIPVYRQLMAMRKQALAQDLWSIGQAYYFNENYAEADSAFSQLAEKQPQVTHGWFWAARSKASIDSTMSKGLAKPAYEKFLEIALQNPEKNKRDIIEAYEYMGAYYIQTANDVNAAKPYYEKILQLDPTNEQARLFMKTLKERG